MPVRPARLIRYLVLTALLALLLSLVSTAKAQLYQWAYTASAPGLGNVRDIARDATGNIYAGGCTSGGGPSTIRKLDSNGTLLWSRSVAANFINGVDVDPLSGNISAVGGFYGTVDFDPGPGVHTLTTVGIPPTDLDGFILTLSPAGDFVQVLQLGGPGTVRGDGIAYSPDGSSMAIVGDWSGTNDFDPGAGTQDRTASGPAGYTLSLSPSGAFNWVALQDGPNADSTDDVYIDASGNVLASGYYEGTVDFDPGAGTADRSSVANSRDLFALKLDSSGNFVWAVVLGDTGNLDVSRAIVTDSAGNVFVAAQLYGTMDLDPGPGVFMDTGTGGAILKFDSAGAFQWGATFDTITLMHDLSTSAAGHVIAAGEDGDGDLDPGPGVQNFTGSGAYVVELTADGLYYWAAVLSGGTNSAAHGVRGDSHDLVVGGYAAGANDFDPGPGSDVRTNATWWVLHLAGSNAPAAPIVAPTDSPPPAPACPPLDLDAAALSALIPGGSADVLFTVRNRNLVGSCASDVLNISVPGGLNVANITATQGQITSRIPPTLSVNLGSINPGGEVLVTVTVSLPQSAAIHGLARPFAQSPYCLSGTVPGDTATACLSVGPAPDFPDTLPNTGGQPVDTRPWAWILAGVVLGGLAAGMLWRRDSRPRG